MSACSRCNSISSSLPGLGAAFFLRALGCTCSDTSSSNQQCRAAGVNCSAPGGNTCSSDLAFGGSPAQHTGFGARQAIFPAPTAQPPTHPSSKPASQLASASRAVPHLVGRGRQGAGRYTLNVPLQYQGAELVEQQLRVWSILPTALAVPTPFFCRLVSHRLQQLVPPAGCRAGRQAGRQTGKSSV